MPSARHVHVILLGATTMMAGLACNAVAGLDGLTFASTGGAGTGGSEGGGGNGGGCPAGTGDCDGDPGNGCETDVTSNANHCGACNDPCPDGVNGAVSCQDSACVIACDADFGNCDDEIATGCEEEIVDNPNHCGGCFNDCGSAGCNGQLCAPETLVVGLASPQGIAIVDETIFICEFAGGRVSSAPKAGGAPQTVVTGLASCSGIASDGVDLFIGDYSAGTVVRTTLDGGDPTPLYTGGGPHGIWLDGGDLYWSEHDAELIQRGSKSGLASPVTLVPAPLLDRPTSVAFDGSVLFFTDYATGAVFAQNDVQTGPEVVASGNVNPFYVAYDADHIYWTNDGAGSPASSKVMRVRRDRSQGAEELAVGVTGASGILVDATHVYFAMTASGSVARLPKPRP